MEPFWVKYVWDDGVERRDKINEKNACVCFWLVCMLEEIVNKERHCIVNRSTCPIGKLEGV